MTAGPVLVAEGLRKTYVVAGAPPVEAVRGVSLSLAPGELVVLAGPSGSGKSTLLALLAGLETPDAGTLSGPAAGDQPWAVQALVPQALGLLDELTLEENIGLPLRLAGRLDHGEAVEVLVERLGLAVPRARRPREASLGEQQRAAIARAFVMAPQLVVLDEPTAHQDARSRDRVIDAMGRAAFEGACVLAATHDPAVLEVAHRHLRMADGRLRVEGADPAPHP